MKKIKIRLRNYFICKDSDCEKIFHNDDDNVCAYCGSKNTRKIYQSVLKGEILDENYE